MIRKEEPTALSGDQQKLFEHCQRLTDLVRHYFELQGRVNTEVNRTAFNQTERELRRIVGLP